MELGAFLFVSGKLTLGKMHMHKFFPTGGLLRNSDKAASQLENARVRLRNGWSQD